MTNLKNTLQKPEPQPVIWQSWSDQYGYGYWDTKDEALLNSAEDFEPVPLYERKCMEYLRAELHDAVWEDGRRFGAQQWWPADQDPATAGLFVVRDDTGNVEVATWLCDWNGKNGEWARELRDVDRDRIVAWMRLPEGQA